MHYCTTAPKRHRGKAGQANGHGHGQDTFNCIQFHCIAQGPKGLQLATWSEALSHLPMSAGFCNCLRSMA